MKTVANFSIPYSQFINEHGEATQLLPSWTQDSEYLQKLYKMMVLVRTFDTKAIKLQRTGKLGTFASNLGQEAVGVGYGSAMDKDDVMAPYYRDYGAQFWRGVSLTEIYRYWGGNELGNHYAENSDDLPISVPIASQNLHAVGLAKAFQYRKQKRVAVTSVGDGGTSEGDFYEALNVAGIWNLPVVFIVNNNQWAISIARDAQTSCETIAQKAIAGGIHGEQVDGNDIIAMHESVKNALHRARNGEGASVIEAITYRLSDHTTADDASRYRPDDELKQAWEFEPIIRMRKFMESQNIWDDSKEQACIDDCKKQVEKAVEEYLNTPVQPVESMLDHIFATLPKALEEQRQLLLEENQ